MSQQSALWATMDVPAWFEALERYWLLIKPSLLRVEQELELLDVSTIASMDGAEWFAFLKDKYFRWKYTDGRRYKTTTERLSRQDSPAGHQHLLDIRAKLLAADHGDIAGCMRLACLIDGLGPAGASGLLSVLFPHRFGTADRFVVDALQASGGQSLDDRVRRMVSKDGLTVRDACHLIHLMRIKAIELNAACGFTYWTPRRVDKALWVAGHVHSGRPSTKRPSTRCEPPATSWAERRVDAST